MSIKMRGNRFNHYLGLEIRAAISATGNSLTGVAKKLDTYHTQMSLYVNNKRMIPANTFYAICEVLGVRPADLVDRAYHRLLTELSVYETESKTASVSRRSDLHPQTLATIESSHDLDLENNRLTETT